MIGLILTKLLNAILLLIPMRFLEWSMLPSERQNATEMTRTAIFANRWEYLGKLLNLWKCPEQRREVAEVLGSAFSGLTHDSVPENVIDIVAEYLCSYHTNERFKTLMWLALDEGNRKIALKMLKHTISSQCMTSVTDWSYTLCLMSKTDDLEMLEVVLSSPLNKFMFTSPVMNSVLVGKLILSSHKFVDALLKQKIPLDENTLIIYIKNGFTSDLARLLSRMVLSDYKLSPELRQNIPADALLEIQESVARELDNMLEITSQIRGIALLNRLDNFGNEISDVIIPKVLDIIYKDSQLVKCHATKITNAYLKIDARIHKNIT